MEGAVDKKGNRKASKLHTKGDDSMEQCKFYLKKKGRLCRFRPKPGHQYCPEHSCILGIQGERKRIPCPLNPTHNCYEDELEKHKRKCNVTKIQRNVEKAVYYVKGVNKGTSSHPESQTAKNQVHVKNLTSEDLAKMIDRVEKLHDAHVQPVESTYVQHSCVHDELCSSKHEDLNTVLKDQVALRKELLQQAALIGQMEKEKFLKIENSCYVELGAGKGKLSHWIRRACGLQCKNKFLLVERGSVRYKVDGHQKQDSGDTSFKRIKMDIEDLYLGKVPELDEANTTIVVGKHLCGGATDMGIRCAVNTLVFDNQRQHSELGKASYTEFSADGSSFRDLSSEKNSDSQINTTCDKVKTDDEGQRQLEEDALKQNQSMASNLVKKENSVVIDSLGEPRVKAQKMGDSSVESSRLPYGILIALCCHHRCTWDTYVGQAFMEECGVSPREFDLLTRLSSWATCARVRVKSNTNPSVKHEDQPTTPGEQDAESLMASSNARESREDHVSEDLVTVAKSTSSSLRQQLSVSERQRIGRLCKRLIDTGRLHYLRSKGMTASLREYIDEDTTPENVVLVAHT